MARLRTQQQTEAVAGFVQSDAGVSFVSGVMYVNGQPQRPAEVQHWMSSNGLSQYTTITWRDTVTGERRTSCNCPGWSHAKKGQKRSCCHTKDMEGVAYCNKERVEPTPIPIATRSQVTEHIATITDTRRLRSILLD